MNTSKYNTYPSSIFTKRYVKHSDVEKHLLEHFSEYIQPIGTSVEGRKIYKWVWGNGTIKILAWSQMHGNESTATLAGLDVCHYLLDKGIDSYSNIQLHCIFMLNPDGAEKWTRRNALEIDINRDFKAASSPEMQILQSEIKKENFSLCLNLHDQRSIFHIADSQKPAILSFLSPSSNIHRSETPVQTVPKQLTVYIKNNLDISDKIGRFSDEFYPNATGDNLHQLGIPTLLIEAGFDGKDYERQSTRNYYFQSLCLVLQALSQNSHSDIDVALYHDIPTLDTNAVDILLKQVTIQKNNKMYCTDIAIQYTEKVENGTLNYIPKLYEVGDLSHVFGWNEKDCSKLSPIEWENYVIGDSVEQIVNQIFKI